MLEIIAQILGIFGIILTFFIFSARKRRTILICKFSGDVLWFFHYLFIGAASGAAINIVNIFREIVFYNKEKKWASSRFWLFFFMALNVTSSLLTWEGPLSLLPMIGTCCTVASFWCTKPLHIRLVAVPGQSLWLLYGILHVSPTSILSNTISLISIGVGLYKDLKDRKTQSEKA